FKFRKSLQTLETIVLQKKGPARKSARDAPFKPFKRYFTPPQQRRDARNLVVGMVRMSERFCRAAGASHALKGQFGFAGQRPIDAKQTDDQGFFGKNSNRFIEQCFRLV